MAKDDFSRFEMRMTAWVVGTVLALSCVILFCASFVYRNILEDSLGDTLNNEISSMTQIIDLRMSRVEYATKTVASTIGDDLQHRDETDTLLMSIITGMECIDGASVIYRKDAPLLCQAFLRQVDLQRRSKQIHLPL